MLIPEIIIFDTIKILLDEVTEDFRTSSEVDSIIYRMFKYDDFKRELKYNDFRYYEQAKSLLLRDVEQARRFEVFQGYNLERAASPCMHILLPSESPSPKGIGQDLGYVEFARQQTGDRGYYQVFTDSMQCSYNLMLTSDNSSEVILIYNFLKAGLNIMTSHMELSGLRNIRLSGQDVTMQDDLVPPHIFHRNLMLSFFYESSFEAFNSEKFLKKLCISGTPY